MSTKPATTPAFDTNFTNVSAPTSSEITDGYPTDAVPTSATWNYLIAWLCAWAKYVSDGDLELNDITADSVTTSGAVNAATSYDRSVRHRRLFYAQGDVSEATASSTALVSSGTSWTFDSWPFGIEGEFCVEFEFFATASTAADTVNWQLLRYTPPDTGAIPSPAVIASGSVAVTASTAKGYTVSIQGSPTTLNNVLGDHSSYILTLSGGASGMHLDGGIRVGISHPSPAT